MHFSQHKQVQKTQKKPQAERRGHACMSMTEAQALESAKQIKKARDRQVADS